MLQIGANWLEQEKKEIEEAKDAYMAENCPAPNLGGDMAALLVRRRHCKRHETERRDEGSCSQLLGCLKLFEASRGEMIS